MVSELLDAQKLDDKGRCCGKKPIVYRRPHHLFCPRCDAAYSPEGNQIENWAYREVGTEGKFVRHFKSPGARP